MVRFMNDRLADDLIIGIEGIADELGCKPRQAQHLIHTRQIPAFRLGGKLAARRSTLRRRFEQLEQQAAEKAAGTTS